MSNVCEYCLNFQSTYDDNEEIKTKEKCVNACFAIDENEGEYVCSNFMLVMCPTISSAVVERFIRKDIDFYENLTQLASLILSLFSYQTIFKVVFHIERGVVQLVDMTNSQNDYGDFQLSDIELEKGFVHFESDNELRMLISNVVEPDSLIFVEFADFKNKYPIRGTFLKLNRFFNRDRMTLQIDVYNGNNEVW